jgi:ABC-type nitrate/sulfonate/bicarbonate transport system substrate-binding protein
MTLRNFLLAICSVMAALSWCSPDVDAQLIKINVGYSALSGNALPLWLAKDAGIFERNGLDAN